MLFKPLAFAATAAAFVIVPEISEPDNKIIDGIVTALPVESVSFGLAESLQAQTVSVPCAKCKSKGGDSHLELDLKVEDGTKLTLNGFELYPNADPWAGDLTASLVRGNGKKKTVTLGYGLSVNPVAMDEYQQMQLTYISLNVIEVGGRFVDGIPPVEIRLIRTVTDALAISSVIVKEAAETSCRSMWCRVQDLTLEMSKAFDSFKGCVGRHMSKHHHNAKPNQVHHEGAIADHGKMPDHDGQGPHGHRRNWRLLLKNIASHIFLPVLMGITAGVGVAVFAMVLCSIAIRVTKLVKTKRCKRSGLCRRKHSSRQPAAADVEKARLIEQVDAEDVPPEYKDDESK